MLEQWMQQGGSLFYNEGQPAQTAANLIILASVIAGLCWGARRLLIRVSSRPASGERISTIQLVLMTTGLLIGWTTGVLGSFLVSWWEPGYEIIRSLLMLVFGYVGLRIGSDRAAEVTQGLHNIMLIRSLQPEPTESTEPKTQQVQQKQLSSLIPAKITDTNIIIDGRIEHIIQAGFLEGKLLIPDFVLYELQLLADSADILRRQRGKRGLDMLNRLRQIGGIEMEMTATDFPDNLGVDDRLVQLALTRQAVLLTNDINLQKICELHQIRVLNVNQLASLLKQQLVAGELLLVHVTKAGKEQGQGIAYLDDGTMIVVEHGREYIGNTVEVVVTSALQTANGKMIFAKPHISGQ
ncbi:PIN/TRAM domain-containing protein [Paenibacillus wulumuqiensis]|uniref:PIN/TRAM domain-containing protein n=1 Tax=Paenibacillus wulumuqiensis TaxID=1567107 RepID=UPI000695BCDA|nr:PIN domain-containing protein [Paenibacillus wulumuqiensis]